MPLYASCWTVLLYFPRFFTVRLKMFYFVCLFLCIICVKSITNLLEYKYYTADCASWVSRLTLWTYEQIRLTNVVLKQNSFVCRGLTEFL